MEACESSEESRPTGTCGSGQAARRSRPPTRSAFPNPVGDVNRLYPGIPKSNPASFTSAIHEGLRRLWMRYCGILRACRAWRFRMELESLESAIGLRCRVSGWDGKGRTEVRPYER